MQKPIASISLTLTALIASACLIGPFTLNSQDQPKEAKDPPPKTARDPFLKKGKGAESEAEKSKEPKASAKAAPKRPAKRNLVFTYEYIDVPQKKFRAWLATNPVFPDATPLRLEVEGWVKAGDAARVETSFLTGRPGQRAQVQSIREFIYPTEFDRPKTPPAPPFPGSFETRNLGHTAEIDAIFLEESGRIGINQSPELVSLVGDYDLRPEPEGWFLAGDVRIPLIQTIKTTSQTELDTGTWRLLGSESPGSSGETELDRERTILVFLRADVHEVESKAVEDPAANTGEGIATFEWIETTHETFATWLFENELGELISDGAKALAEDAVKAGEAEVLYTRLVNLPNGQRIQVESIREVIYPSQFDPPDESGHPSNPMAMETRNTGVTIEVDPVFAPDHSVVDLNMSPEIVKLTGQSVHRRIKINDEWVPDVTMPEFYTMKVSTQLVMALDSPILVAVFSPPDEKGIKNPDKKVLLFVTVTK